jgi:hypothetical protein
MQLLSQSTARIHRWEAKSTVPSKPLYPWADAEPAIVYYLVDEASKRALASGGETEAHDRPFAICMIRSRADEEHVADDLRLRLEHGQGIQVVDLREG